MDYLIQFQLNIFGFLILIALYHIAKRKSKVVSFGKRILKWLMIATGIAIIVDPLTWVFDGMSFFGAYFLEYISNFTLFLISPIIGGLMISYAHYYLFKKPIQIRRYLFFQHFSILTFLILLINIFIPIYFEILPTNNSFHSGPFKDIHFVFLIIMYLYMAFMLIRYRKYTIPSVIHLFLWFFGLPLIGMIVQLFIPKLNFSWPLIILSLLIVYIFLETESSEHDHLTNLYNRMSYEAHLNNLIELKQNFTVILIDLNNFKEINDTYGHQKGDEVLIFFSTMLLRVFPNPSSFVCRLGGDEFVVISTNIEASPEAYARALHRLFSINKDPIIQELTFSYGYQSYHPDMSFDDIYASVDKKMYEDKADYKAKR